MRIKNRSKHEISCNNIPSESNSDHKLSTVLKTRLMNLCLSCGACAVVCPTSAISYKKKNGLFVPKINVGKCILCRKCITICPGSKFTKDTKFTSVESYMNSVQGAFNGFSLNPNLRKGATSGGLISQIIYDLAVLGEYNVVFALSYAKYTGKVAEISKIEFNDNDSQDSLSGLNTISQYQKSKYIPASIGKVLEYLSGYHNLIPPKTIIVGTPCQTSTIRLYCKNNNIDDTNILVLGVFCDRTLNYNIYEYYDHTYIPSNENINQFHFRSKKVSGWPGDTLIITSKGNEIHVSRNVRMQLKDYYQTPRCLFCSDKLNKSADIAFGDCYILDKMNKIGKSSILVHSPKGNQVLQFLEKSGKIFLERELTGAIIASQKIKHELISSFLSKHIQNFIKDQSKCSLKPVNSKDFIKKFGNLISKNASTKLSKSQTKQIISNFRKDAINSKIGQVSRIRNIRIRVGWSKIKTYMDKSVKILRSILVFALNFFLLPFNLSISHHYDRKSKIDRTKKPYILLTGISFSNKGSQAMAFTAMNELSKRFPNKKFIILSTAEYEQYHLETPYKFIFIPWSIHLRSKYLKFGWISSGDGEYIEIEDKITKILNNTAFVIDLSGFSLSSKFNLRFSLDYLFNILTFGKLNIPIYLLPQSFGPLDYPIPMKWILNFMIKLIFRIPRRIYGREKSSCNYIHQICGRDINLRSDLVLSSPPYNHTKLYGNSGDPLFNKLNKPDGRIKKAEISKFSPKGVSENKIVAIFPHKKFYDSFPHDFVITMYTEIIKYLEDKKYKVFVLRHSYEDMDEINAIREKIDSQFNGNITFIYDNLDANQLNHIIENIEFAVASRYHSAVHCYKLKVPVLNIGWAD